MIEDVEIASVSPRGDQAECRVQNYRHMSNLARLTKTLPNIQLALMLD
jgi:hypothetical protein